MIRELRMARGTCELRAEGDDGQLVGRAVNYGKRSRPVGIVGFEEVVLAGAFTDSLASDDQAALFNHDPGRPLGRRSAGTLELRDSDAGLDFVITPPEHERGVLDSVRRRDIRDMSFAFSLVEGGEAWQNDGGTVIRTVSKAKLWEVSPVTFPQYEGTRLEARSEKEILAGYTDHTKALLLDLLGADELSIDRLAARAELRKVSLLEVVQEVEARGISAASVLIGEIDRLRKLRAAAAPVAAGHAARLQEIEDRFADLF